jgi:hypothetical protein
MIGVVLSLGLPKMLMTRKRDEVVDYHHLLKPPVLPRQVDLQPER